MSVQLSIIFDLARNVGHRLSSKGQILTCAESCTGGGIAYAITEIAGSSEWFERGFVTYSNQAKQDLVAVKHATLTHYGAVSEQTVEEMAIGALQAANADWSVAVSGIAGPSGGTKEKPVGLVCFAYASAATLHSERIIFTGERSQVRLQTMQHAFTRLLTLI